LHVPPALIHAGARLAPPARGALMRLQQDLVADNGELERLLGVHPRPFRPGPECWDASGP
jgi:hypothetical protein